MRTSYITTLLLAEPDTNLRPQKEWKNRLWCKLDSGAKLAGLRRIECPRRAQAASAALHSSDMLGLELPNLPVLNWSFLIFSANSIPLMVTAALSKRLNRASAGPAV
jgi:hypothetical protein